MSCWTTTVPNSVRISAPVGQTSRQAAWVQCLHTSLDISQREPAGPGSPPGAAGSPGRPICSMNATWRQVEAFRLPVTPLKRWMEFWRAEITRRWPRAGDKPIWQKDFYDRQLRSGESYHQKWLYIVENP